MDFLWFVSDAQSESTIPNGASGVYWHGSGVSSYGSFRRLGNLPGGSSSFGERLQ